MTYEPSDKMVQAAARAMQATLESRWDDLTDEEQKEALELARAALKAAFAAAIEAGEAKEADGCNMIRDEWVATTNRGADFGGVPTFPCIILRTQEGEK